MDSGGPSPLGSFAASRTSTPASVDPTTKRTVLCVYCGSSPGTNPAHMESARQLAKVMAEKDIALVYGGGTIGLMGELARTLVALKGPSYVHGIIPEPLVRHERDPQYTSHSNSPAPPASPAPPFDRANATPSPAPKALPVPAQNIFGRTTVVADMHTRKHAMAAEVFAGGPGSGFLALSGGYGTIEELLETCTWNQLGIHNRGVCVLNIAGFYDGILDWIRRSVAEGFIKGGDGEILGVATSPEQAVEFLGSYKGNKGEGKISWGKE